MLQDLGIAYIAAHSPQAKGRAERLWATLQDRLVSELRLRGITTVAAATAYLPEFMADFTRRFGRPPAVGQPVWRRAPAHLPLVLSCRYRRVVARDNTVHIGPRWAELPTARSYAGLTVEVRELLDGRLVVLHDGLLRAQAPPPPGPFALKPRRAPNVDRQLSRRRPTPAPAPPTTPKTHSGRRPRPTHPWDSDVACWRRNFGGAGGRGSFSDRTSIPGRDWHPLFLAGKTAAASEGRSGVIRT